MIWRYPYFRNPPNDGMFRWLPSFEVIFRVIFLQAHDSSGVEEFESTASRFSVVQRSEVFGLSVGFIIVKSC